MSLVAAAQHIASKGRGEDTMLVHMTPREVAGLQALAERHGGSLTRNPETGLPEAGFLKNILPMVAGIAGAAMGLPTWAMPAIVGGGTALATGNLMRGIMAGLGAYGGANIGAGMLGAGSEVAMAEAAKGMAPELWAGAGTEAGSQAIADQLLAAKAAAISEAPFSTMGQGLGYLAKNPMQALSAGANAIDPNDWKAGAKASTALAPFMGDIMGGTATPMPGVGSAGGSFSPRNYRYDPQAIGGEADMSSRERPWFSAPNAYTAYAIGGEVEQPAGIGGLTRGPGDGVSDSIPAQINGREPAKLADGEFVLPARIVSEIGNGSTEAGAKRLYAMMDRIQQRRQKSMGRENVAVDSRAYEALPA